MVNPIDGMLGGMDNQIDRILTKEKPNPIDVALDEKGKGFESNYNIVGRIKRDALLRPDIQAGLDLMTGGKSSEFLHSEAGRKAIDIPVSFSTGFISGRTFGLPQLLTADFIPGNKDRRITQIAKEALKAESAIGEISQGIGHLWGFARALPLINKLYPAKWLNNIKPTTKVGVLANKMVKGGFMIGGYSVLSEHGGKSLIENIKMRGASGAVNAGVGAIFGAAHGITGDLVKKGAGKMGLKMTDAHTHMVAFMSRMGVNQYFTGLPAFKRYLRGEGSIPGLIFQIGLGTMFSLSKSPLQAEANFNRTVKSHYKLMNMRPATMTKKIASYGTWDKVPVDLKWAYIMKVTGGRIKPTYTNAGDFIKNENLRITNPDKYNQLLESGRIKTNIGATDHIIMNLMKRYHPKVYEKFDYVDKLRIDAECEFMKAFAEAQQPKPQAPDRKPAPPEPRPPMAAPVTSEVGTKVYHGSTDANIKKFSINKVVNDLGTHFGTEKAAKDRLGKKGGKVYQREIRPNKTAVVNDINGWDNPDSVLRSLKSSKILTKSECVHLKSKVPQVDDIRWQKGGKFQSEKFFDAQDAWYKRMRKKLLDKGYDSIKYTNKAEDVGSESWIALRDDIIHELPSELPTKASQVPAETSKTTVGEITPAHVARQENNIRSEIATDRSITSLKRLARKVGLLYKSKNNKEVSRGLTRFLAAYYDVPYSKIKTLTEAQVAEAKQFMQMLVPGGDGKIKIPTTKEILPLEMLEEIHLKGNIFDWFQSGRMAVRPVYELMKPAYQRMLMSRRTKIEQLNNIYQGRVKKGGEIDQKIAKFADGKLKLKDIPQEFREIAIKRQEFYNDYADKLIQAGVLDPKKVFNKDGTRKPYYHRIFDDVSDKVFRADYGIEDIWLPGRLGTAGALKRRKGAPGFKYSAIESDTRYVYGIEKYINLREANDASIKIANQYTGMRKSMANTYLRFMRGQPTSMDKMIKETWDNVNQHLAGMLDKAGMSKVATKLRNTSAPSYPVARITSPLARVYYWRYVGLAVDTSFKNLIQWEHAMAKHGMANTSKAMRMQFSPEGKRIIRESGIHDEGIQRSGHFISESPKAINMNKLEEASYFLWSKFDANNRNISGLSAYYDSRNKGMSHDMALKEMRNTSHETQYGYCVTPDTECLTRDGWKQYNKLNVGDNIFTLNMKTNKLKQQPIRELGIFDYSDKMIHIKNTSLDKIMTPNHRCVIRDKKNKNKIIQADNLKHSHRIARIANYDGAQESISDDMVRLVGWSVTEGNLAKFRNCKVPRNFRLYQSLTHNPHHCQSITQILDRLGGYYNTTVRNRNYKLSYVWSLRKPLSNELYKLIPENRLHMGLINKLSKRQCELLLQTMVDGDGWRSKVDCGMWFSQSLRKKINIDMFQIIAYLAGYTCTIYKEKTDDSGIYFIAYTSKRTQNTQVGKCKKETIEYTGKIWCPVVDNGTWVAKRNGKIFITGNTKADSLLIDMANPMSRFIMFKKWPLAKVEMIRQWAKDGNHDAIFTLALQEYLIYRAGQTAGVDMGNHFGAIWNLAVRGITAPSDMVPFIKDIGMITDLFKGGKDSERAKEKLINTWQGLGNRYVSKGINVWRAWMDDWNVREHNGQLKYKSSAREQVTSLITRSLETTKRREDMREMDRMKSDVLAYRTQIARALLGGDGEKAAKLNDEMLTKYTDDYLDFYGKRLDPVTMGDALNLSVKQETSQKERLRKSLPGKSARLPVGQEYPGKERVPQSLLEKVRGY